MLSVHLVYTQCILSVYSAHVAIILQQTDYQQFTEDLTAVVYIVYIFLSTKTEFLRINCQPKSVHLISPVGADSCVCLSNRPCLPVRMPQQELLHHELPTVLNVDALRQAVTL